MSWKTIDRTLPMVEPGAAPVLSDALRAKIKSFFPRYDTKRAVLLPALHVVQDALGHVSFPAMKEIAEVLEIPPSAVMDTLSFYTHFWTHPKGEKVVTVCRSISCEVMGGREVLDAVKLQLGVEEHQTTSDGKYSLATEECLAGCDYAPCLLINEKLHKCVKASDVPKLLADAGNDKVSMPRSDLFDGPKGDASGPSDLPDKVETTSDVSEMREAD